MAKAANLAYDTIREAILNGDFKPGERLPEQTLVSLCGCSRTPVREALRRLAADHYVVVNSNQGAQVRDWDDEDIDELFELRALLEGSAASRAAARIGPEALRNLNRKLDDLDEALNNPSVSDKHKVSAFLSHNSEFHGIVVKAANSPRLESLLSNLIEQAIVVHTAQHYSMDRIRESQRHHRELVDALKARNEVWAKSVMTNHIYAARAALSSREQH